MTTLTKTETSDIKNNNEEIDDSKEKQSLKDKYGYETHHNTRESFEQAWEWLKNPPHFLVKILFISLGFAVFMLLAVLIIAFIRHAPIGNGLIHDSGDILKPTIKELLHANIFVLLFHSFVCFAAFLGFYVVPEQAKILTSKRDINFHKFATKFVAVFIILATAYSVTRQIWITSASASELSNLYGLNIVQMIISILPHALLELTGMFLPLAGLAYWEIKRLPPKQLYALSIYTFILGLVFIIIAAVVEHLVWAEILSHMIFN